jgi:hypothetical protein
MHTSIHSEFAEITRHPHAMVYGLYRALLGDRAFLSPSLAEVAFHKLDASVEASGPHGFAVRLKRIRQSAIRVHRIPPHVRDDRETPLRERRDGVGYESDLGRVRMEIFLRKRLDRPGKSDTAGCLFLPDCAEFIIGRAFTRPVGFIQADATT